MNAPLSQFGATADFSGSLARRGGIETRPRRIGAVKMYCDTISKSKQYPVFVADFRIVRYLRVYCQLRNRKVIGNLFLVFLGVVVSQHFLHGPARG